MVVPAHIEGCRIATVSMDTCGSISGNACGIAEMNGLYPGGWKITDTLDSDGNTTAAIGKEFAGGSGALAALALMIPYLYSFNEPGTDLILNMMPPMILAGTIVGAALPFLFSGMLIDVVAKPNYKTYISISPKDVIGEMKVLGDYMRLITTLVNSRNWQDS